MKQSSITKALCLALSLLLTLSLGASLAAEEKLINTGELVLDTDGEGGYSGEYVVIYNPLEAGSSIFTGNMFGLIENSVAGSASFSDTPIDEPDFYRLDVDAEMPYVPFDKEAMPHGEKTSYQLGDTKIFTISSYSPGSSSLEFSCIGVGEYCYIWTPTGENSNFHPLDDIDPTYGQVAADEFDAKYPLMNYSFGDHENGNQGDGKVHLMYYNIDCGWTLGGSYVAGYFSSYDFYSNGLPMIHLDTYPGVQYTNSEGEVITHIEDAFGVQSHEYQHLINYSRTGGMDTWLNESMSAAAEEICYPGSSISSRIQSWLNYNFSENGDYLNPPAEHEYTQSYTMHNGAGMYYWNQSINDVLALYAQVSLYSQYLFTQYGNGIFSEIIDAYNNAMNARTAIEQATGDNLSDITKNFRIALTANDPTYEDGVYGFTLQEGYDPSLYYDVPNLYNWLAPVVFTGNSCNIEPGGAITVKPIDGEYYPPADEGNGLKYIGISFSSEPPAPIPLTGISIEPSETEVFTGAGSQVSLIRVPENANNYEIEWISRDPSIATVSGNKRSAIITGVSEGETVIECHATDLINQESYTAYVDVTVLGMPTLNDALNVEGGTLLFESSGFEVDLSTTPGRVAAVSTNTQDNSVSAVSLTLDCAAGDTLSFDWMVSSEMNYDKLRFKVNGAEVNQIPAISGEVSYTTMTYTVPSDGRYVFSFEYTKDISQSSGADRGWVDEVCYTPIGQQEPTYTVTFVDGVNGDEIESYEVLENTVITEFPEPPVIEGYVFTGWDYDGLPIISDTVITALYTINDEEIIPGDANCDGEVNAIDALYALRHSLGALVLDGAGFIAADMDGNGTVTALDALAILRLSMA